MNARDPYTEIDRDVTSKGDEEGLDSEQLKELLGFIWRSPRRRPMLALALFAIVAAVGLTVAVTMPRTYNAQVKLLAQHDLVLPALSNPGGAIPREADDPTRNASAMILRRENLIALAKEANLLERWRASRSAALRLKDTVFALISGPPREDEELQNLVQTLEKRLIVTSDDNTVTIAIDWNDPQLAFELVNLVQKNFVEAHYDSDVRRIQDAIGVLEEHAKTELEQVDSALAAYQTLRGTDATAPVSASPNAGTVTAAAAPPMQRTQAPIASPLQTPAPQPAADADLTKALEEKRRQIRAFEDERQRSTDAIKQQLMQAQLTLTAMHPTVIALRQKLDTLSEPSSELAGLKSDERALMAAIAPPAPAVPASASPPSAPSRQLPGTAALDVRRPTPLLTEGSSGYQDQSLAPARSKLDAAIYRYQEVMARIDGAKLYLDITRKAYRYRYSVITPAEVARGPKRPIATLVGFGSVLGAVLLAFLGAAAADWRAGRFLETWQIRRRLKIDVLCELEPPL